MYAVSMVCMFMYALFVALHTDCVDELIFKLANAPVKKLRIEYV